ncbi:MAG: LytTR family DNA-binding domain-containing protein [Bacteroidales bacterium]|nr:LytTR family DNA-binding domain-containing protein [Bacteroidales bacterium]
MKILIIEDELPAVRTLKKMILDIPELEAEIVAITDTVESTIDWLKSNPSPELVFMDIHLPDGLSFDIFNTVQINCPIIFTTAYDQYAIEAFKLNSIDYILKPYNLKDVERAVNKMLNLTSLQLETYLDSQTKTMKKDFTGGFLVMQSDRFLVLRTEEIAYFYTTNERTIACTFSGVQHEIDKSLEGISDMINPNDFTRANRQFIIARKAVKDVDFWFGSRLSVNLVVKVPEKIIVSKLKASKFKEWLVVG